MRKKYEGPLNMAKMNKVEKRAYKSWKDQGSRCIREKDPRFYCYGAKGIQRVYGPREFIAWYLDEYYKNGLDKHDGRVHVDRIDSNKNYEFGNVRILTASENVKLRNDEHGNPTQSKKIIVKNLETNEVFSVESLNEATRLLGIQRRTILNYIDGKLKRRANHCYDFSYDK